MYSIGLWIKELSSHMAPKRSPYRSLSLSPPLIVVCFSFSLSLPLSLPPLSLRLFHPSSLAPPWHPHPPRTLQFSNGFVLADYVSLPGTYLPTYSTFHAARCTHACVRTGMFIRHNQSPHISPLSGTNIWSRHSGAVVDERKRIAIMTTLHWELT